SAGLRGLMKLRKQTGKVMSIRNVSSDVYEIFQTTGFTDLFDVQKRLRVISVEGCEKIGEGGNGKVFRLDEDKIVKVYKPWMQMDAIERERSFARTAFINGIPSVIAYDTVKVPQPEGECLGIVFEMLDSDTLGHAMAKNHKFRCYYPKCELLLMLQEADADSDHASRDIMVRDLPGCTRFYLPE
ncbi:MAG: hypothetical protein IKN79_04635, partial [Eubacterium sp.]|nr:hypothetical protein [Eubacterium sp.]